MLDLDKDPYDCVSVGDYIDNGQTLIIGFCAPRGDLPHELMVNIKYKNGSETTRTYASVLVDKIKTVQ
jgi:hypothetical protein